MRHRDAAVLGNDGAEGVLVHVVDLSAPKWPSRLDDLVAGREDGHTRLGEYLDGCHPEGRQRADAARPEEIPGSKHDLAAHDIGAPRSNVLTGAHGAEDADRVVLVSFGFLHHDDRVGPLGHGRARGDLDALACVDPNLGDLPGEEAIDLVKPLRQEPGRLERVVRPDGVAVHGRARERGHVAIRHDLSRHHPAVRLTDGHTLNPSQRHSRAEDYLARALERNRFPDGSHFRGHRQVLAPLTSALPVPYAPARAVSTSSSRALPHARSLAGRSQSFPSRAPPSHG